MENEKSASLLIGSHRETTIHSAAVFAAVLVPVLVAEGLLIGYHIPAAWVTACSILFAACVFCTGLYELRILRLARKTEIILESICASNTDLLLQEGFSHMSLPEQVNYVLSCLTDHVREEYESTLLSKQAELFALQAQINPHFLYNTLDAIRGQAVMEGADEISDTIEALSNLFKYSISQKENLIPLRKEIDNLIYYMKIQKYRYLDKIDLVLDIEDNDYRILGTLVPKLTLQPIIENAIYHGLEPKIGKGTIKIHVFTSGDRLQMTITDDGVGMDEETLIRIKKSLTSRIPYHRVEKSPHGIALYNANRRIQQYFGPGYGIDLYSTQMLGTRVELSFPYRKEACNNEERTAPV